MIAHTSHTQTLWFGAIVHMGHPRIVGSGRTFETADEAIAYVRAQHPLIYVHDAKAVRATIFHMRCHHCNNRPGETQLLGEHTGTCSICGGTGWT